MKFRTDTEKNRVAKTAKTTRIWSLRSMTGRYAVIGLSFVLVLLVSAGLAQRHVTTGTNQQIVNSAERHEARQTLRALLYELWIVENSFYEYMLAPDMTLNTVPPFLERAREYANQLSQAKLAQAPEMRSNIQALQKNLAQLNKELARVMALRVNAAELYPALRVMTEKLLPAYNDFYNLSTLAMMDAEKLMEQPGQRQIYKELAESRHAWILMVSAFRTFVSYRFGIFPGDALTGMEEQASAIDLYAERVRAHLRILASFDKKRELTSRQSQNRRELEALLDEWIKHYKIVAEIYASDQWRTDLPILRDNIQPLFALILENLRKLDMQIQAYSAQNVTTIAEIAKDLSRNLWLFVLFAFVVTASVFLLMEYALRRPIKRVARALRAEALGLAGNPLPPTNTLEVNDLVEAFTEMREQVQARQQRLEIILDHAAEGILTFDTNGRIESINKAAKEVFGYAESELLDEDIQLIMPNVFSDPHTHPERFLAEKVHAMIGHEGEAIGQHKDGTRFPLAVKVSRITLRGHELFTALVADISERKALLNNLKIMAEHDGLTQLYNRSYFMQELERIVERARRDKQGYALLYLDLDNFKYVNDTLGHLAGDRLLIEVAQILKKRVRTSDLICRLGGDEFTVLLYNISATHALAVAELFRAALADYTFRHQGEQVRIGCSIGVAVLGAQANNGETILSQADIACSLAKRSGRNRVHLFEIEDEINVSKMSLDMGWSNRIKHAITDNRFALVCQPIVCTRSRQVEYYEVLVRLRDEQGGLILPSGFFPSAERFGLANDIDKWVITRAIGMLAAQRKQGHNLRYSINLSGSTLSEPGIAKFIQAQLTASGLDPAALMFEITETMAISDMSRAESLLSQLKSLGCAIALDDFGSGLSSFGYLKDLQVDMVKIDGRFVKNLGHNPVDQAMVKSMNEISHALGKKTIAEWVEDENAMQLLHAYGVDFAQGFHLGRPEETSFCESLMESGESTVCIKP